MNLEEQIKATPRRHIRYVMFSLGSETGSVSHLAPDKQDLAKIVKEYYENKEDFPGWIGFSKTWDIGTDEEHVLGNWEDSSRQEKWYTWGISKLKICKNPGLPRVQNRAEGVMREYPNPMPYMYHAGYAKRDRNGNYYLLVDRLMKKIKTRDSWPPVLETQVSLVHSEV